ncbi:MAG: hypothetical protein LBU65_14715 [Planctomycetaceae bacterium]|jgi:hypothetical protein|nr:hypothetical protein [Planctomycetaceae bacterium]
MKTLFKLFVLTSLVVSSAFAADDVLLTSDDFVADAGNYVPLDSRWGELGVFHGNKGKLVGRFTVATGGEYNLQALYASDEKRPCTITVARAYGKSDEQTNVFATQTGGFLAKDLKWESAPKTFKLEAGDYTMTIAFERSMPHFRGFRITTDNAVPAADIFLTLIAEKKRIAEQRFCEENAQKSAATRSRLQKFLPDTEYIVFIKRATFQSSHYYTDFIDGARIFGAELCLLSLRDGSVKNLVPSLRGGLIGRCNLSFDGKKIIFDYKRQLGEGFRIWEVGVDGTGLRQLTFPPDDEEQRIAKYRMDKHNAVSQIWAGYKGIGAGLYAHHTDDFHPAYLPDGGFVFTSTRCEHGILCDGPDVLTASVLYRSDKDGKKLEKLSDNSVSESCPTVMEDGRVLYTRWEYVDNGSVTNKGLWSINPDGTASSEIYGANIAYPSVFNTARQIPGQPTKFVCIGAPHMPVGVGTILLVDTRVNRRTVDGVHYVTPEVDQQHQSRWQRPQTNQPFTRLYEPEQVSKLTIQTDKSRDGGGNTDAGPLFMDPFPLDEHNFIASFNPDKKWNDVSGYGLYYINDSGERELLYRDNEMSAWCPIPVRAAKLPGMPTVARDTQLAEEGLARLVVLDVYAGMDNVKRGTVKYLRINEHVPRPWSARRYWSGDEFDQQHSAISKNAALGLRVQHGIVPVEADGSANFVVPADKNIFIQALDEKFREVQRERTFVNYRPGEIRSCVGCHEQAAEAPIRGSRTSMPLAMQRQYDRPAAQPGEQTGARPISYFEDVQPIWDKHCMSCHNDEKADGKINLAATLTTHFNRSYETLMDWNAAPVIRENHPKAGNNHYLPPYTLGANASKLVSLLEKGHYDAKLSREEWIRLTTWLDANGQYYGTYFGKKNIKYKGEKDFRPTPTFQETQTLIPPME